jgi:hypothetical protein
MFEFDTQNLGKVGRVYGFCVISLQCQADERTTEVSYLYNVIGRKTALITLLFFAVGFEKLLAFLPIERFRYPTQGE